jgi:hypothetical protein
MKWYIIQVDNEYKIIKVQPDEEDCFLEEYADRIKAEADSLAKLLQQLEKLPL